MNLTTALSYLGALWIALSVAKIYQFVAFFTTPKSLDRFKHVRKGDDKGRPWALISGSSSGIGLSYAHGLAARGFNVVIHGRSQIKMAAVKQDILRAHPGTEVRILILDAYRTGPSLHQDLAGIAASLKDIPITLLINNIGTGQKASGVSAFQNFVEEDVTDIDSLIDLNVKFTVQLTRVILPLLIAHDEPALVVNMLSGASNGSPYLSVYSGAKAFLAGWSKALAREMRSEKKKVEVLAINTMTVGGTRGRPEMQSNKDGTLMIPHRDQFAESVLTYALGAGGLGELVVEGWWVHGAMDLGGIIRPRAFMEKMTNANLHVVAKLADLLPSWYFTKVITEAVKEERLVEQLRKKKS